MTDYYVNLASFERAAKEKPTISDEQREIMNVVNPNMIVGEDMICPVRGVYCDDEVCPVGAVCNMSNNEVTEEA